MDRDWWLHHLDEVNSVFIGERFSNNNHSNSFRTTYLPTNCYANSGAGSIVAAALGGAKRIVLLGYDCQKTNGKAHWHGNHPRGLGNASKIENWGAKFEELAKDYKHIEIINASRETALTCFPKMDLDKCLLY